MTSPISPMDETIAMILMHEQPLETPLLGHEQAMHVVRYCLEQIQAKKAEDQLWLNMLEVLLQVLLHRYLSQPLSQIVGEIMAEQPHVLKEDEVATVLLCGLKFQQGYSDIYNERDDHKFIRIERYGDVEITSYEYYNDKNIRILLTEQTLRETFKKYLERKCTYTTPPLTTNLDDHPF